MRQNITHSTEIQDGELAICANKAVLREGDHYRVANIDWSSGRVWNFNGAGGAWQAPISPAGVRYVASPDSLDDTLRRLRMA